MKFAVGIRRSWLRINLSIAFMATLIISCAQVTSVYAMSDYDNVIQMGGDVGLYLPVNSDGMGRCSQPYLNDPKSDDLTTSLGRILLNPGNYTNSTVGAEGSAFWQDLLNNPDDYGWSVSQYTNSSGYKFVQIAASTTRGAQFETVGGYKVLRTTGNNTRFFGLDYYSYGNPNIRCDVHVNYNNNYGKAIIAVDGNASVEKFAYINYDINYDSTYPQVYEGTVASAGTEDSDDDDLTLAQETAQGTSDSQQDTDHDGLSDYVESGVNPDRNAEFCDTSTPKNCAYPDPTKQDVYVEIDWMNDGTVNYKPTSTQLTLLSNMFSGHNIKLHVDTGEYGGGNELPTYSSPLLSVSSSTQVDYYDYKSGGNGISSNFASNRDGIWHYMITGNRYTYDVDPADSSGWASAMGSNVFVGIGYIKDDTNATDQDRAIADTLAHEIGHNLCLTGERLYFEQPASCAYQGVDNKSTSSAYYNLENYESVMNYRYQLTDVDDLGVVDYSDGSNSTNDHDDWSAISSGLGMFNGSHTPYVEFGANKAAPHIVDPDGNIIVAEAPVTTNDHTDTLVSSIASGVKNETNKLGSGGLNTDSSSPNSEAIENDAKANKEQFLILDGVGALTLVGASALYFYNLYKKRG